ncbi:hypothetical protein BH09BAC1_BH09BAC1_13800 [soil metagenome]
MHSKVVKYYALGLLAIVISFNAVQIWHNGWAHRADCDTQEVQQHAAANSDCLLCTLFFTANLTNLVVWNALVVSVAFMAATWQSVSIEVAALFNKSLRGPPIVIA